MKARQTKFALYTTVYVLIVLAALGVLNFLANRYNKSYSLKSGTTEPVDPRTLPNLTMEKIVRVLGSAARA